MSKRDRFRIIDAEDLAATPRDWLAERADVISVGCSEGDLFFDELATADALVVRTYTIVDAALLDRAPNLKVVGRAGVGLDNVDVAACRERGIEVVYTPDANASTVAELVFGLLLDVLRPRTPLTRELTQAEWVQARRDLQGRRELSEMTLGIWGMGRVGSKVARGGVGFGMRVLYHDLLEIDAASRHGAEPVDLETLLAESDVLSLHVDGRPSNRALVDADILARLKSDAILVNASRGFVAPPHLVREWLDANESAHVICDVHDPEPVPTDHPLLGHPRALLVPHLGAGTRPAKTRMGWVVKDVLRVLNGEPAESPAP